MATPVEVSFKLDIGQGDAMEKLLGQLTELSKQFEGAVKFKVGVGGKGGGVGISDKMNPAVARLVRGIPGGGLVMAFKGLGMIGGVATIALGVLTFVKKIFNSSKILGTISSTFFKVMGAMVDLMLAPLMPFMIRVLVWMVQKGFPLATRIGNFLVPIAEAGGGAGKITMGIVTGDVGKTMEGLKDLGLDMKGLSARLLTLGLMGLGIREGEAQKFADEFMNALKVAKDYDWIRGTKEGWILIGGWIWSGLKIAFETAKDIYSAAASIFGDALRGLLGLWRDIGKLIGEGLWGVLNTIPGLKYIIPNPPSGGNNLFSPKGNTGGLLATPRPVEGGGGGLIDTAVSGVRNVVFNAILPGGVTLPIEVTDMLADRLFSWFRDETDLEDATTIAVRGP